MARSPEASPQSSSSPGSPEAFSARVDSASTSRVSRGPEGTGAHHDVAGPTWGQKDQEAAVGAAQAKVAAAIGASNEVKPAQSQKPRVDAIPAPQPWTHASGPVLGRPDGKPEAPFARVRAWLGGKKEAQTPAPTSEADAIPVTTPPPVDELPLRPVKRADEQTAGVSSPAGHASAGAPSSESPKSPETPIVPLAEPPAVVGGPLASLRRRWFIRDRTPAKSGPPASARRGTSPSPVSPPEPTPWHASPTSLGEATSPPTPVFPVYESRTPAVTAPRAATTHNRHTIAPVEPLTVVEQPFGVLYANRSLTPQERQTVGQYQEELRNYYDQMMSRFSRLLSPWALVDEWTGAADPAANEMIKGQVRHFGSLSNVATLSLLQGSENPNKARVSTISELPEVTIASIGGIRVQYAAKPWFVKTETGPDGTARTVVAVGTKTVKREGDARHINSDPLQVSPTAENTNEEYAVEYFVIPGEFTAATLGDARVTDMRPRGRDDDGTKWDRVAWDYTKLHHLTGIDPQELKVVATAVNDIFNHASAPMPQQQDGMPSFMVYPEAGHLKVVKTAVANANDLATARQTAALAHQSAMSREAAGHQELLDTLAALRSSGTGGKKRKPR